MICNGEVTNLSKEKEIVIMEQKVPKMRNIVGYGTGDIAGNVVYAFLSSFVMIYLTNTVGLNAGIVGTLIAVSKLFDGISDVFFGSMIDKTKSKMGKKQDRGCSGVSSDVQSHYSEYLQSLLILEKQHSMLGSLLRIHY